MAYRLCLTCGGCGSSCWPMAKLNGTPETKEEWAEMHRQSLIRVKKADRDITVFMLLCLCLLCFYGWVVLRPLISPLFTPESIAAKEVRRQQEQNSETAFVARGMVRNVLMDGESARFDSFHMGKANSTCGRVNAKNAYGAYTGSNQFMVINRAEILLRDHNNSDDFDAIWSTICQ